MLVKKIRDSSTLRWRTKFKSVYFPVKDKGPVTHIVFTDDLARVWAAVELMKFAQNIPV